MFLKNLKLYRSERSFSIMLAEEILRAELKSSCGPEVKLFRCNIVASPEQDSGKSNSGPKSELERDKSWAKERMVAFQGLVGPFERSYPSNPSEEDSRREIRRFSAQCRIFSVETGCIWWQPHWLELVIKNPDGIPVIEKFMSYETWMPHLKSKYGMQKNAENPCQDMCDSQTPANYYRHHFPKEAFK